jgi:hypothetical protein
MIKPGAEALLSVALLSELDLRMGLEAGEFLIGAGERIGEATTAPALSDLGAIEAWMNGLWRELGMGEVILSTGKRQLILRHRLPEVPASAALYRKALPSLIEGIYRAWMNQLDPMGQVVRTAQTDHEIEFVYAD